MALLHFRTPLIVIDDSSLKNAAESFTVALTLTLGGYESAIKNMGVLVLGKAKNNLSWGSGEAVSRGSRAMPW